MLLKNKWIRYGLELSGWILFCSLPLLMMPAPPGHRPVWQESGSAFLMFFIVKNLKFIFLYYINKNVLIPRYLANKKVPTYAWWLFVCFVLVFLWPTLSNWLLPEEWRMHHFHGRHPHREMGHPTMPHTFHHEHPHGFFRFKPDQGIHFFMSIIVCLVPLLLYSFKNWIQTQTEKNLLELRYLKSQINHHFLFNSLNSIYVLSESSSPDTSRAIYNLSSIMRYMMGDSHQEKVPLKTELEQITNYIGLQQLRLPPNMALNYTIEGEFPESWITPMILLTFIENCFKHGILTSRPGTITIQINLDPPYLELNTANALSVEKLQVDAIEGIGMDNARRRLEHDYPEYRLTTREEDGQYILNLRIKLS